MRADPRPIDKPFVPKGPRTPGTGWWPEPAPVAKSTEIAEHWWQASGAQRLADLVPYQNQRLGAVFTPFLPRFHPDGTYHPFLPHFYPVFTPFWRVKCVGVKRRVKTG